VATRRVLTRVDDLDVSTDAHTVRFGLDGREYEIDLTDVHARQFRELFAPYVSAGRRLTRSGRPRHPHWSVAGGKTASRSREGRWRYRSQRWPSKGGRP
jgi:Lsr2